MSRTIKKQLEVYMTFFECPQCSTITSVRSGGHPFAEICRQSHVIFKDGGACPLPWLEAVESWLSPEDQVIADRWTGWWNIEDDEGCTSATVKSEKVFYTNIKQKTDDRSTLFFWWNKSWNLDKTRAKIPPPFANFIPEQLIKHHFLKQ